MHNWNINTPKIKEFRSQISKKSTIRNSSPLNEIKVLQMWNQTSEDLRKCMSLRSMKRDSKFFNTIICLRPACRLFLYIPRSNDSVYFQRSYEWFVAPLILGKVPTILFPLWRREDRGGKRVYIYYSFGGVCSVVELEFVLAEFNELALAPAQYIATMITFYSKETTSKLTSCWLILI